MLFPLLSICILRLYNSLYESHDEYSGWRGYCSIDQGYRFRKRYAHSWESARLYTGSLPTRICSNVSRGSRLRFCLGLQLRRLVVRDVSVRVSDGASILSRQDANANHQQARSSGVYSTRSSPRAPREGVLIQGHSPGSAPEKGGGGSLLREGSSFKTLV